MTRIVNGKQYTIVSNGMLYNASDVKEGLIQKGYSFLTESYAEIVLLAFIEYNEKSIEMLNGAFTYTIWDDTKKSLFLARDRLGLKPLFYLNNKNSFIFASEIKSILEHPDSYAKIGKDEICELFGLGPAHSPGKTFFKASIPARFPG